MGMAKLSSWGRGGAGRSGGGRPGREGMGMGREGVGGAGLGAGAGAGAGADVDVEAAAGAGAARSWGWSRMERFLDLKREGVRGRGDWEAGAASRLGGGREVALPMSRGGCRNSMWWVGVS
jgi:hypothetical protein